MRTCIENDLHLRPAGRDFGTSEVKVIRSAEMCAHLPESLEIHYVKSAWEILAYFNNCTECGLT